MAIQILRLNLVTLNLSMLRPVEGLLSLADVVSQPAVQSLRYLYFKINQLSWLLKQDVQVRTKPTPWLEDFLPCIILRSIRALYEQLEAAFYEWNIVLVK